MMHSKGIDVDFGYGGRISQCISFSPYIYSISISISLSLKPCCSVYSDEKEAGFASPQRLQFHVGLNIYCLCKPG